MPFASAAAAAQFRSELLFHGSQVDVDDDDDGGGGGGGGDGDCVWS